MLSKVSSVGQHCNVLLAMNFNAMGCHLQHRQQMADSHRQELTNESNKDMLHGAHAMCDKIWQGVCGQRNKE